MKDKEPFVTWSLLLPMLVSSWLALLLCAHYIDKLDSRVAQLEARASAK